MLHPPIVAVSLASIIATASCHTARADKVLDLRDVQSFDTDPRLRRDGNRLMIRADGKNYDSILIPRMYASLKPANQENLDASPELIVLPETDHWVIRWKTAPGPGKVFELQFDSLPELADEVDPIRQLGDGRLDLHAHQAQTSGEKLRYEPQAHKNTVGYWVNAADFATWSIQVGRPGKFNVGILQGCGADQGGSIARLSIRDAARTVDQVEFTVEETGHFQNFVWRTVGVIEIPQAGHYTVQLQPKTIKMAALLDVRQIQLVLVP